MRYPEVFSVGDFRQLFVDVRGLNPDRIKHCVLIDFTRTDPLSATSKVRKEAAEVIQENMEFLLETTIAEARVAPNPITRGVLTVFDWLNSKKWATENFSSGPAAELWLRGQIERAGFEAPSQPAWVPSGVSRSA